MTRTLADEDLLTETRVGNADAFEAFYRRWMPAVMNYHRRATGSAESALDLTAETFAAVIASIDRFDRERGAASVWLFAIARHKLHESFRRARVEASARKQLGWAQVAISDEDLERVEEIALQGWDTLDELIAGHAAGDLRTDVTAEDVAASLLGIFTVAQPPEHEARANRPLNVLMDGLRPL